MEAGPSDACTSREILRFVRVDPFDRTQHDDSSDNRTASPEGGSRGPLGMMCR